MNSPYQLPPILSGSAEQQLRQLRDYLVRLARELPTEAQIAQSARQAAASAKTGQPAAGQSAAGQDDSRLLKSLIVKTADQIHRTIEVLETSLRSVYVAQSDFGRYQETVQTQIAQTARETVESYGYAEQLRAVGGDLSRLEQYLTQIDGEIRRGVITDPETAETVLGIAISQNLSFTGQTVTEAGLTYYELSPGQTLGLYTSTGWQFWINGSKRGWFDSADGMLHAARIVAEDRLQLGADWLVTGAGGFGVRCIGA